MRSFIFVAAVAAGLASASETTDWASDVTVTATTTQTHTVCPVTPVTTCDAADSTDVSGDHGGDAWYSLWNSQKSNFGLWEDWETVSASATSTTSGWGSGPTSTTTTTSGSSTSCPTYTPPVNSTDDICNSAADRSTWCDWKDISSDYYSEDYDTGVTREYTLEITNTTLVYDGTGPKLALAVNGQVPGPVIEANWGDTLIITVINKLADNSTSIHFHGIRQFGTNDQDGVPGVTECAIAGNGGSRTYTWKASSYGTSWYHSHMFAQYGDGIRGPIVIHGPATANYDYDLGTVMIDDTFTNTAATQASVIAHFGPGGSFNTLFNGMNKNPDPVGPGGTAFSWGLKPCRKHLFRIINSSSQNSWIVSFDSHTMTVIAADFVPIVPYETTALYIANGQRYDVIVEADQIPGSYYVRAVIQTACPSGGANSGLGSANAIINYEGATPVEPINSTPITNVTANVCQDEPLASLVPYLQKSGGSTTAFQASASTVPAGSITEVATNDDGTVFNWFINNAAINVNYSQPTLKTLADGGSNDLISNAIFLNQANTWVYFIIVNQFFVAHPLHIHGHDVSVLGQGVGTFTPDMVSSLNFDNPTRRDTVMLQGSPAPGLPSGYTVIGFETDNPGAWVMHCHIAWHVDGGLALQFVERPDEISGYVDDTFNNECSAMDQYQETCPWGAKTSGQSGLKARGYSDSLDFGLWTGAAKTNVEKHRKRHAHHHAH